MPCGLRVENQEMARAVGVGFEGILAHGPDALTAQALRSGGLALGQARRPELDGSEPVASRANKGGGVAVVLVTIGCRHEHDTIGTIGGNRPRRGRPYC